MRSSTSIAETTSRSASVASAAVMTRDSRLFRFSFTPCQHLTRQRHPVLAQLHVLLRGAMFVQSARYCKHVVRLAQMLKGVLMGVGHATHSNEQGQEPIRHVRPLSYTAGFFEVAHAEAGAMT